jgi:LCP family protein required for cell wall assembly
VLLIGSDAGPDRWSLRTDTLIVLSVDVATGRAALFGIPRNVVGVPLPPESAGAFPDGRFPGLLNALYVYAMGHPASFPGGDARGFRAVSGAVQELVGMRLDGLAVVRLAGFVRLVDAVGGLWIDVPERVVDRAYPLEDGSGYIAIDIQPGCQQLDGRMTLAYARSRRQDSDYGRMRRQQQVLLALRRQVDRVELLVHVPELLDIAGSSFWMTFRADDLPALARLAADVPASRIQSTLFVPPRYPQHLTDDAIARIRHVVRTAFDTPLPPPSDQPSGDDCP